MTCERVNGKPRITKQVYLGRKGDVPGRPGPNPQAKEAQVLGFGAPAALLDIARELKLVEVIDEVVKKRRQGLSVGEYILLAALNRAIAPTSKRSMWDWYQRTVLWRLLGFRKRWLSSQRFWDNLGQLTTEQIRAIEQRLSEVLIERFGVDLKCLLYDTTNFYTWIDTETRADLPQRGHNKQRRTDLRQVGLALVVTRDHHIPLFHQVYRGNQADTTEFAEVVPALAARYPVLARGGKEITVVFDKGNNSAANLGLLSKTAYHFVGSLVITRYPELLKIPRREYEELAKEELPDLLAYRTKAAVGGAERTVVLTFNPEFYAAQLRGILHTLKKKGAALDKLSRWAGATQEQLAAAVQAIAQGQYSKEILHWQIETDTQGPALRWWIDEAAFARIKHERLGKTMLFTDQAKWSTLEIVRAYRGQYQIEHAFRQMKRPHFAGWWPMFHWTDQKIMVHGFYCVLSLLLTSLLVKRVKAAGLKLSSERLLTLLGEIKEVEVVYPEGRAGARSEYVPTRLSAEAKEVYELLALEKYLMKKSA